MPDIMAITGIDYIIKVHSIFDGSLRDPVLGRQGSGEFWAPHTVSIRGHRLGQRLIYRWLTGDGLVTLTVEVLGVVGRHPHRSLFMVVPGPESNDVKPEITLQPLASKQRREVWRQDLPTLGSAITRTQQLHSQVYSLLTALPLDDV